jgi:alpha-soluble NSF attachment protein
MSNTNAQTYIDEAKKLENSKSVFEFLMKDITSSRYEKIAELYNKAGNIYKISDKEKAIKCFKRVLHYNRQLSEHYTYSEHNIKDILLNIAELYSKIDYTKSVEYYEQIINYYTEKGDVNNIIKYYEIVGDLYWTNNCVEESKQIYMKTLNLIDSNLSDKYSSTKKRIGERLCEILLTSNNFENILQVSKIYFGLAEEFVKNKLLVYQAKKYILLGLLADCAGDDTVKAKMDLEKYSSIDYTFASSREGKFIQELLQSIESSNSEELSYLCAELDKIIPLDNIQVNLLTKIKNLIDYGFGNDVNNGQMANMDDELDLA